MHPLAPSARPLLVLAALTVVSPAFAGTGKADVCHAPGPSQHVIAVSSSAVGAHLGHGDHVVTEEVCDDGVDNDCDGVIDADCCPCFTSQDLLTWFDAGDACIDFDFSTPGTPLTASFLADYTGAGLAAGAQNTPSAPPFCAVVDLTNTGLIEFGIAPEAYDTCVELVLDAAETLEITCTETPPVPE